ncbi:uncharacterized protein AMSG_12014 [Thecamonas trahens ATCC 50062]|uniref:Uncharacterized protein n=1 Tax=Thecamonas trahens ATCC 50062 TaxID=461836 RepID=A0A0L0DDX1_THETB|nr:hypothetical protein AMSG_12014 [Thecamonas trahens ATCC 50062]KNC50346.1 hypothetical protein AMSG_12014 [Thecamonas trahens ATCC 50062]|eukprot:XP_013756981.1 hypothetical protein AMSG_12014 [Thecamonas trahens ATCC 50062]
MPAFRVLVEEGNGSVRELEAVQLSNKFPIIGNQVRLGSKIGVDDWDRYVLRRESANGARIDLKKTTKQLKLKKGMTLYVQAAPNPGGQAAAEAAGDVNGPHVRETAASKPAAKDGAAKSKATKTGKKKKTTTGTGKSGEVTEKTKVLEDGTVVKVVVKRKRKAATASATEDAAKPKSAETKTKTKVVVKRRKKRVASAPAETTATDTTGAEELVKQRKEERIKRREARAKSQNGTDDAETMRKARVAARKAKREAEAKRREEAEAQAETERKARRAKREADRKAAAKQREEEDAKAEAERKERRARREAQRKAASAEARAAAQRKEEEGTARQREEVERKRKAEKEAAAERKRMEEEKAAAAAERKREEEARRKAEEKAAAERKRKAEEEAAAAAAVERKREEEARRKAEEKAAAERKRKAEEEAAAAVERKREEEARRKAEEKAAAERKRKAEEEAAAAAANQKRMEEEARRKAEKEAAAKRERMEEEKAAAAAERKREEEARRKAEEKAAAERKRKAEEARRKRKADEEKAAADAAAERKRKAKETKTKATRASTAPAPSSPPPAAKSSRVTGPASPADPNACRNCKKRMYPADPQVNVGKKKFHKTCFLCAECGKRLTPTTYQAEDDIIFCKRHANDYIRNGRKADEARAANAARFEEKVRKAEAQRKASIVDPSTTKRDKDACPTCSKKVYIADPQVPAEGYKYHKTCFVCSWDKCGKVLTARTYERLDDLLFCKRHLSDYQRAGRPNRKSTTTWSRTRPTAADNAAKARASPPIASGGSKVELKTSANGPTKFDPKALLVKRRVTQHTFNDSSVELAKKGDGTFNVGSVLRKAKADKEPVLMRIKGKRQPFAVYMPVEPASLNSGDSFVLDLDTTLFVFKGRRSNRLEKVTAMRVATRIRDKERSMRATIHEIDQGSSDRDVSNLPFWTTIGGMSPDSVAPPDSAPDDATYEAEVNAVTVLYRVAADGSLESVSTGRLDASPLGDNDVFVLDSPHEVYVWLGRKTPSALRNVGVDAANRLIADRTPASPAWLKPQTIKQNTETTLFIEKFSTWGEGMSIANNNAKYVLSAKEVAALKAKEEAERKARAAERARKEAEEAERMKDPAYRARKEAEAAAAEQRRKEEAIKRRQRLQHRATTGASSSRIKDLQSKLALDVSKMDPSRAAPKPGQARALAAVDRDARNAVATPSASAAAGLAAIMTGGAPGGALPRKRVSAAQQAAIDAQKTGTTERLTTPAKARPVGPAASRRGRKRPTRVAVFGGFVRGGAACNEVWVGRPGAWRCLYSPPTLGLDHRAHLDKLMAMLRGPRPAAAEVRAWLADPLADGGATANVTAGGRLALVVALAKESPAAAAVLATAQDISLDAVDADGVSPLQAAMASPHVELAQIVAARAAHAALAATSDAPPDAPTSRTAAAAAVSPEGVLYVCGGREVVERRMSVHAFDLARGVWLPMPRATRDSPRSVAGARALYFAPLDSVFVLGGRSVIAEASDAGGVWRLSLRTHEWRRVEPASSSWDTPQLSDYALIYVERLGLAILSGGMDSTTGVPSRNVYVFVPWDGTLHKLDAAELPVGIMRHAAWIDGSSLVVAGGVSSDGEPYRSSAMRVSLVDAGGGVSSSDSAQSEASAAVACALAGLRDAGLVRLDATGEMVAVFGKRASGYVEADANADLVLAAPPVDEAILATLQRHAGSQGAVFGCGMAGHMQLGLDLELGMMVGAPSRVGHLPPVRAIFANGVASFALDAASDNVYMWGANCCETATLVPHLRGKLISSIGVGVVFAVAASAASGRVYTLGTSITGSLGAAQQLSPDACELTDCPWRPAGVNHVDAGALHALLLDSEGRVWSWGENPRGQLGRGGDPTSPALVEIGTRVAAIAAGATHSVALSSDGLAVYAWGSRDALGLEAHTVEPLALEIPDELALPVTHVAASEASIMLIDARGALFACGNPTNGRLGVGEVDAGVTALALQRVTGLDGVKVVKVVGNGAYGYGHCCALADDGRVFVWGSNAQGRLGLGSQAPGVVWTPCELAWASAPGSVSVTDIAAGGAHLLLATETRHAAACPDPDKGKEEAEEAGPLGPLLGQLPTELLFLIVDESSLASMLALGATCRAMAAIVDDPLLWRRRMATTAWPDGETVRHAMLEYEARYGGAFNTPWRTIFRDAYIEAFNPRYHDRQTLARRRAGAPSTGLADRVGWFKSMVRKTLGLAPTKRDSCLFVGLDAAGKTSLLYLLARGELIMTIPTIGFNIEDLKVPAAGVLTCWDTGGCDRIRPLVRHYLVGTGVVVHVVAAQDERLVESVDEFHSFTLMAEALEPRVKVVVAVRQPPPDHPQPPRYSMDDIRSTLLARSAIDQLPWRMVEWSHQDVSQVWDALAWAME